MRRRRWVTVLLCFFAIPVLFSTFTSASSTLRVNEAATQFLFEKEKTGPALAVENSLGREVSARVLVELLDPQGKIRASAERDEVIKAGASSLFIPLSFRPGDLKDAERSQLLWYRLRYRIAPKDSVTAEAKTEGIVSLSGIAPDLFEVRAANYEFASAGTRLHARLHAAHPLSGRAVAGVEAEAQLKLDEDEQRPIILRASGVTDADGYATLIFDLPPSIKTEEAELKITARRGALVQEATADVHFDLTSRIFISTDKPLYQPGQTLHARALVFSPAMKAVADTTTPFKIEDPEGTTLFRAEARTSRFGIASVDWPIPENARLGEYTVSFGRPDDSYAYYRIKISRYDLPNFTTKVKPDRSFYLPGQNAEVLVRADYLFGQAVRRGRVRVVRETEREWNYREQKWETKEGDKYEGETDADGRFVAHVNLEKEFEDLKDSDWNRFRDVSYAAYFTDPTTNRTEQRRFDLRVTKEALHVYVIGETYDQSSRLPLEFYVSTFYADGTPAECNVLIRQGVPDDGRLEVQPGGGRRVAIIRTNSFGLAKVALAKPPTNEGGEKVNLRFYANDAKGQTGHINEYFNFEDEAALRVRADRTLHRQGEPVTLTLVSSEKNLEAVVDVIRDMQVLHSELVHLRDGRASLTVPYDKKFSGVVSVIACANMGARDRICDGRSVLYPRDNDLKMVVRPAQATYRPGDEARINFNVLAPDGRATESALGVTIFDRAVEERARTDQEFGQSSNFYGNYGNLLGWDDSLAGVTRKELEHLDFSKPLPKGLELLAEVMLNQGSHYSPDESSGDDYDLDQQKVFADLLKQQLDPVRAALNARFWGRATYPRDEGMLRRMLAEFDINLDKFSDPWGTPYRTVFYVRTDNDMLKIESAGADKRFGTPDDFAAAEFAWPYFKPTGEAIDRALKKYHERTGGYIRDAETFQAELLREGIDFKDLRDRWGEPYRVLFEVSGVNYILRVMSSGPDRKFETANTDNDDFTLWTSQIDYFAEHRAKLNNALTSYLKETHNFPQDPPSFSAALRQMKIDFDALRDPWGHQYYVTFKTESRYTDRVTVETVQKLGEQPAMHANIKPVTQQLGIVTFRSAGADGIEGSSDDFDAATFSLVLSEQDHSGTRPKTVSSLTILTGTGGAIAGTVVDPMGAVIPSATVRATLSSTEQFFEGLTDADGRFALINLPPGTYELSIRASGFRETIITNILVSNLNVVTLNTITLQVGGTTETVTVTSDAPQVETSAVSITSEQFSNFPSDRKVSMLRGGAFNIVTKSGSSHDSLPQNSTPRLREYFPETLVWQPSLETDAQGRASLRFKLADNITTWKLAVIGSTVGGEIGIAEKEILAFQPFFVEHDPPRVLTEGDEISLPVVLRNYLDKPQTVELSMQPENWFTLLGPAQQRAQVPAGDSSRRTFDFRAAAAITDGKQRVTARGATASDQIERSVSVHPDGEEVARTTSGILGNATTLETVLPAEAINHTARAELKIYPNLLAHVVESIEGIMRRPYGCAEQTISAAYPGLLALRAYKGLGQEHPDIETKARRYVQQGYERLLNYRVSEGGFSYWGRGDADLALTAYALRFLHDAREFVEVDPRVINEAREWLIKQQRADGSWPARVWWEKTEDRRRTNLLTAYLARVLAQTYDKDADEQTVATETSVTNHSSALKRALRYLSERSKEFDEPYLIASYALAAMDAGDLKGGEAAVAQLAPLAREEAGTVYWSLETNTPFYGWGLAGRIETTALVLQALNKYCGLRNSDCGLKEPASPNPQSAIRNLQSEGLLFLLRQQDRYGVWYSTQATVNALDTLVSLLAKDARANAGGQAQVYVNGNLATAVELPPGNKLSSPLVVDLSQFVSTGHNRVEVRRAADSARASAQIVSTYYVPWSTKTTARADNHSLVEDSSKSLRLSVSYDKSAARVGEEVTCRVEAERIGFKGYGMMLAEIGLPPGADVDRATLEDAMKNSGWSLSQYDVLPDRVILYLWPQAGGTRFEFKFRPRFGLMAQSAPSVLYDYYNPEARVVVAPTKFVVR